MVAMFSSGLLRGSVPAVQTGQWVSGGDMGAAPTGAAVVALADGRLLITGGAGNGVASNAISIYDPAASAWLTAGQLLLGRSGHAAAALKDRRIVIAGGRTSSGVTGDIEIYDPATGASVQAGQLTVPRVDHAAAMLTDGRVLIVGGSDGLSPLSGAEIFDAGTGQSAGIAAGLSTPRVKATATTLLDGHVLVAGGNDGAADLKTAELFDAVSGTFFPTGAMSTARSGHSAVLLPNNNQVLIAGGASAGAALASAELYADWRDGFSPAGTNMSVPRAGALAGGLQPYSLAFVGGGGPSTGEYYGYATVKTDKDDYWPGEPVTVTGSGWQPGETVTVTITEDADTHNDFTYTAVADNAGNFTNSEFAPIQNAVFQHFGMRFYVKARGAASEALNTFTDGNVTLRLSAAEGVPTMTVSWTRYNGSSSNPNNACSGTDTDSGTLVIAAGGAANIPGFGNNNSVRLTAVASSTPAKTFDRWTSGTATVDSNVVVPGSPTPCIARNLAGTNGNISDVFAHFTSTNAAPAATAQSVATNEDTAKAVTLSGSDPDGNALTFSIVASPSHGTLGAIGTVTCTGTPSSCSATVTYTPAANFNGSDSFSFKVNDGTADSPAATVSITVDPVNDAPTFTKGADQTVPEDASAQTVPGWATAISAGPSDEAAQTLTFSMTNDNNQLFTVQPTVASNGTLTFTPVADASGSATVTVKLADDGGTANGGVDSSQQTFTITVTPVNDAPSFTKGSDQSVNEDAGAQSVTGWATGVSAGPNEGTQTVSFQITNNTNAALFSAGPAVDAAGNLTYTAAADANGSATITLVIKDDGGTANGGVDTSAPQTFVIAVTAVNDAPTFTKGADQTVLEDAGAQTVAGWATAISAGPTDESGQTLTFLTTNSNNALFSSQPTVGANGTLTYTSAQDANGTATVTVRLSDNGGTANGGQDHSEQTFTITITPVNDGPANVMAALSASSIAENQSTTVSGSFTDPDAGDTHTVTIVWGDGSPSTVLNLAAGVFVYSAPHQYLDDNPTGTAADVHSVSVTVTDNGAPPLSGLAAASVTVNNVAPVISALVGPMPPQPLGSNVTVTGTFTDQGTQDTHTCSVTWDDGSTTSGTVTEANGSGTCTASRVFAAPGVYSIDMKITDDDGGFATRRIDSEYVVVFDPSGGFVTGGGWIMSPAGASPMYPTATGKANFGFVSKYKKGSNIPEGQTEFQFKAGDLNFHSSAYDLGSLVVSGGKAQYRGTGTVNGVAGYRFLLIAYDGQGPGGSGVDRFRIKITLGGTVVYDNRMGASEDLDNAYPLEISGGSIDIHR